MEPGQLNSLVRLSETGFNLSETAEKLFMRKGKRLLHLTAVGTLSGQRNFHDRADNRWQPAVTASGNYRVSLWHMTV